METVIKKVFKPCAEGRHDKCKGKLDGKICICPHHFPQQKDRGKLTTKEERNPHYRHCYYFNKPETPNPECDCKRWERVVYAGQPAAKRQVFELVCILCGNEVKVYPAEQQFEDEINKRQENHLCSECKKGTQKVVDETLYDAVCENCGGDDHATEECPN